MSAKWLFKAVSRLLIADENKIGNLKLFLIKQIIVP